MVGCGLPKALALLALAATASSGTLAPSSSGTGEAQPASPVPCYWNLTGVWRANTAGGPGATVKISSQHDFFTASSLALWNGTQTGTVARYSPPINAGTPHPSSPQLDLQVLTGWALAIAATGRSLWRYFI